MKTLLNIALPAAIASALLLSGSPAAAQTTKLGSELTAEELQALSTMIPNAPAPQANELVHIPPTMDDLEASDLHPKMKEAIRRGYDLFTNTQQLRGEYVFNNMNCSSCHMGDGRLPYAGPVWPAAVTLPAYRGKNNHVNNLEERIAGCFTYSMNGKPLEYGSDDMLALSLYHQWLATGVKMYPQEKIYGRGFPRMPDPELSPSAERGRVAYQANCATCHQEDGGGVVENGEVIFPALWGDNSYNWGAGISRVFTLASFTKHNMPLGQPNSLSGQDAWDIAQYINSHERPQDPRYTGDAVETREKFLDTFHKHTLYGTEMNGRILGDHDNVGGKDFLRPDTIRPRDFSGNK